jgi:hypothetical protein
MATNSLAALEAAIAKGRAVLLKDAAPLVLEVASLASRWADQIDVVEKTIRRKDGQYCVFGESGKNFGCYDTKPEAETRLKQIERFSKAADGAADVLLDAVDALNAGEPPSHDGLADDAIAVAMALCPSLRSIIEKGVSLDVEKVCGLLEESVLEFLSDEVKSGVAADRLDRDKLTKMQERRNAAMQKKAAAPTKKAADPAPAPAVEAPKPEAKESAWNYGSSNRARRRRAAKGLPSSTPEGGIHIHGSERENSKTKRDGQHGHCFILEQPLDLGDGYGTYPAGTCFWTDEDGAHEHVLGKSTADVTDKSGDHFHRVRLYSGKLYETTEEGAHSHEMQISSTAFDGLHYHTLELPNQTLRSVSPGEAWALHGETPQEENSLLPAASVYAQLGYSAYEGMAAMHSVAALKSHDSRSESERSGFRKGEVQVLKMPDPEFVLARLRIGKSAGIISTRCRKSRIGEAQALVNELAPGKFDRSLLWGFVSYGEAELYKNIAEMPEEVRDGIDPHTRREFEGMPDVYYMPIQLLKALDPVSRLRAAPAGRRFAGKIDLAKDVVDIAKCMKCTKIFESAEPELRVCSACRKASAFEQAGPVAKKGATVPSYAVKIAKVEEDADDLGERYIKGAVLVPDEADAQGDIYNAEEVRKAAHTFMELSSGRMKIMHKGEQVDDLVVLETYLSSTKEAYGDETYPVGTWFMGFRASDEVAKKARTGEFTGLSIGGSAVRESLA